MSLQIGAPFPAFSLVDETGNTHTLVSLHGQATVFVFYPGDMTPGCTIQLCAIRDAWSDFSTHGIKVLGVNAGSAKSHKAFSSAHKLSFPLLVDEGLQLSKATGLVRCLFGFCLIRRTVVGIDAEGIVRYMRPGMPKPAEILKAMKPFTRKATE